MGRHAGAAIWLGEYCKRPTAGNPQPVDSKRRRDGGRTAAQWFPPSAATRHVGGTESLATLNRVCATARQPAQSSSTKASATLLTRNLCALFPGLRQSNRDRLLSALHSSALAAFARTQSSALAPPHRASDRFTCTSPVSRHSFLPFSSYKTLPRSSRLPRLFAFRFIVVKCFRQALQRFGGRFKQRLRLRIGHFSYIVAGARRNVI